MFKTTYFSLSVFEDSLERKTHFHINETTSTFPLNSQEDRARNTFSTLLNKLQRFVFTKKPPLKENTVLVKI